MEVMTRSEMLQALSYMGVNLPPTTRLPDDVLEKRLRDALNFSQHKSTLPSSLNPDATQKWPSEQPIHAMLRRANLEEADEVEQAERAGEPFERALFEDAFWDLRQTMMSIGLAIDNGRMWFVIQDVKSELCTIMCRVLACLDVDMDTPAVVMTYRAFTEDNAFESAPWSQHQIDRDRDRIGTAEDPINGVVCILSSRLEMKILLQLLAINAKILSSEYIPAKGPHEDDFKTSILFPLGPLNFDALGSLNSDPGCAVCGKKQSSRCSQCQSVSYCSKECQRTDWPAHKKNCRSLKGGQWCTVPFRMYFPGCEGQTLSWFNRRTDNHLQTLLSPESMRTFPTQDAAPPPNVHGEKTFLVKLQAPIGMPNPVIMMYDRHRSFREVFFYREDAPEVYDRCIAEIQGPRGGYQGTKMYRWAKRRGDRQLSLCLDREPNVEMKW